VRTSGDRLKRLVCSDRALCKSARVRWLFVVTACRLMGPITNPNRALVTRYTWQLVLEYEVSVASTVTTWSVSVLKVNAIDAWRTRLSDLMPIRKNLTGSCSGHTERGISLSQGHYWRNTTQTQKKRRLTAVSRVGFEPMIPVYERTKIFRAFELEVTVIGTFAVILPKYFLVTIWSICYQKCTCGMLFEI
jgi:hypothetical protein